jgi:hypothetical protein
MRKIGYIALSLYLLLVGLSALIANLMVPNTLIAVLALIASFGIFLDVCVPSRKIKTNYNPLPKELDTTYQ